MDSHTQPIGVGFHHGIPAARYHADPCAVPSLSSSAAVDLIKKSPAHVFNSHPRLRVYGYTDTEETAEMSFGSVVHELALGRGGGFAVWSGDTWRGKEAAAFWDSAVLEGKTPIKKADLDRASRLVDSVRAQLEKMGLGYVLTEGASEVVAVWQDGDSYMRAMFDRWIPDRGEIWDIKTTSKPAHPDRISRIVAEMDYDLRSEFYLMGAEKLTGLPSRKGGLGYQFLFVETAEPYLVTPCYLSESFRTRGRQRARKAIDTWGECMKSGKWPGYTDTAVEILAPGWVDFEIEEAETAITASGERIL